MDNQTQELNKQRWLKKLEDESWSAELIISGAAIYGSFQLPWLLNKFINFSLLNFNDDILDIMYLVFTYLTFTITILMVNFVMHFILRSLWVGLIGLTSVYPEGINEDSDNYSKNFLQQLKHDFSDLRSYNAKIDSTCSVIFAFSFSAAMIFLSIAIMVITVTGMAYLFHQLNQSIPLNLAFFFILGIVLFPGILHGLLNHKKFRDKPWVQKIHYPLLYKWVNRIMFHVFFEPISYINNTFITNFKKSQYLTRLMAYMALVLPVFITVFIQSNAIFANKDYYFNSANQEDRFYPIHYEDQLGDNQLIQNPLIPSAQIEGSGLNLFLPLPAREKEKLNQKYGNYPNDPKLSEAENLVLGRAWFKAQAGKYFHIEINGKKYAPVLRGYNHRNGYEYGFITFIPASLMKEGENVLHIQAEYVVDGKKRACFIPFWYSNR